MQQRQQHSATHICQTPPAARSQQRLAADCTKERAIMRSCERASEHTFVIATPVDRKMYVAYTRAHNHPHRVRQSKCPASVRAPTRNRRTLRLLLGVPMRPGRPGQCFKLSPNRRCTIHSAENKEQLAHTHTQKKTSSAVVRFGSRAPRISNHPDYLSCTMVARRG